MGRAWTDNDEQYLQELIEAHKLQQELLSLLPPHYEGDLEDYIEKRKKDLSS